MKKKIIGLFLGVYKRAIKFDWNLSDIYLVSYPKSGNTFLSFIIANILIKLNNSKVRLDYYSLHDFIPDIHLNPNMIPKLNTPRFIKSHEQFNIWEKRISVKGKKFRYPRVIYIVRDGRHVMKSYYYFLKNIYNFNGTFANFLAQPSIRNGEWANHVRSWLIDRACVDERKVYVVYYEELLKNPFLTIKNLLEFCGLKVSQTIIEASIKDSNFDVMKEIEIKYGAPEEYTNKSFTFARKGNKEPDDVEHDRLLAEYFNNDKDVFDFLKYRL